MTTPNPEPKLEQRHFEALELVMRTTHAFGSGVSGPLAELPAILRAQEGEIARLKAAPPCLLDAAYEPLLTDDEAGKIWSSSWCGLDVIRAAERAAIMKFTAARKPFICADCFAPLLPGSVCDCCESFGALEVVGTTAPTPPHTPAELPDGLCVEDDGCPTERAVLQRFWREHQAPAVPDIRAAFEHYYSDEGEWPAVIERSGDGYRLGQAQSAWVVWQDAARVFGAATPQPAAVPDGQQLWLWQNGDHYLAFAHEYPCYEPAGDPMTLGEPVATALFRQSFDREQANPEPAHLCTSSPDHGEQV